MTTTSGRGDRLPASLRTEALEQLLTERGLIDPKAMDGIITTYETNVGPLNGAKVVANAWTDPGYRRRLLEARAPTPESAAACIPSPSAQRRDT
ncbi:nitrile hydratase subunit alpha [Streptomyces sp. NPDC007905]|uniref:nitrile hydratase subunit alpha n=1 Tax=Streptomyces sp. NPDC007905 TaxID=3364788 RepID=UPI0036E6E77C